MTTSSPNSPTHPLKHTLSSFTLTAPIHISRRYSYMSKANLETALRNLGLRVGAEEDTGAEEGEVRIRYHPVFLDPTIPSEGLDLDAYLQKGFGYTKEEAHADDFPLRVAGRALDDGSGEHGHRRGPDRRVEFSPHRRVVNTLDAFALLEGAKESADPALQNRLAEALSRAYFEEAEDISDRSVLARVAKDMGCDDIAAALLVDDDGDDGSVLAALRGRVTDRYDELKGHVLDVPHILIRSNRLGHAGQDGVHVVGNRTVDFYERSVGEVLRQSAAVGMDVPAPGGVAGSTMFVAGANATSPESLALRARRGWPEARNAASGLQGGSTGQQEGQRGWEDVFCEADFARTDETEDGIMYEAPRLVAHLDEAARGNLTAFYRTAFLATARAKATNAAKATMEGGAVGGKGAEEGIACLDICSSWLSHYPPELLAAATGDGPSSDAHRQPLVSRVAVTGINQGELEANEQATEIHALDLNALASTSSSAILPYDDESFDFVTYVWVGGVPSRVRCVVYGHAGRRCCACAKDPTLLVMISGGLEAWGW